MMGIIQKVACKLGFHKFGDWQYTAPDKCEQMRVCMADNQHIEYLTLEGKWEIKYRIEKHVFGEWEYVSADNCDQKRVCIRDGYTQHRKGMHQFGEWEFLGPDKCEQKRTCIRDNHIEYRTVRHDFEIVDTTTNPNCTACGGSGSYGSDYVEPWTSAGEKYNMQTLPPEAFEQSGYLTCGCVTVTQKCKRCGLVSKE